MKTGRMTPDSEIIVKMTWEFLSSPMYFELLIKGDDVRNPEEPVPVTLGKIRKVIQKEHGGES